MSGSGGRGSGGSRRRSRARSSERDDAGWGTQIEGRRPVLELLRAQRREPSAVLVSERTEPDATLDEIRRLAAGVLRVVSHEELSQAARTDAPQGVVAFAAGLETVALDALLDADDVFLIVLDGVTDPRNFGAVLRCAETAGVTGVVVPRQRSAPLSATALKASAGAAEYVPIARVGGVGGALDTMARADVWTVGLDGEGSTTLDAVKVVTGPVALVLGAEGRGLAPLVRQRCDVVASIPMRGRVESLNVSAAACIAAHDVARRRGVTRPGDSLPNAPG